MCYILSFISIIMMEARYKKIPRWMGLSWRCETDAVTLFFLVLLGTCNLFLLACHTNPVVFDLSHYVFIARFYWVLVVCSCWHVMQIILCSCILSMYLKLENMYHCVFIAKVQQSGTLWHIVLQIVWECKKFILKLFVLFYKKNENRLVWDLYFLSVQA